MTSADRPSTGRQAGCLTVILVCCLAVVFASGLSLPSESRGATYIAKRQNVYVELRTSGNRLTWVDLRYTKRCNGVIRRERDGGTVSDLVTFDRGTGRFFNRTDLRSDSRSWLYVLGGTRHPGLITGFLSFQSSQVVRPGPNIYCHSGRSWQWPRVRFVARMVTGHRG